MMYNIFLPTRQSSVLLHNYHLSGLTVFLETILVWGKLHLFSYYTNT